MAQRQLPITLAAVCVGLLLKELDLAAFRVPLYDALLSPPDLAEPEGCVRLKGPIGAEDAVVLDGEPPILLTGELDAGTHEFTNLAEHGSSASTTPKGALWAVDRLDEPVPRLTRLEVPLPDDVSTLHTHGLGLHGDILFAVNHAFAGGGERIERWLVERLPNAEGMPPVRLTHLGAITGHEDEDGTSWTFTARLNAAVNDVAPIGPYEFFMTQFLDDPASLEGAASGTLEEYEPPQEGFATKMYRRIASKLGVPLHAKILLQRLRKSRIWHCYCAEMSIADLDEEDSQTCKRTACQTVGPNSTCWNGITYRAIDSNSGKGPRGYLYVNDIFRRVVVEFAISGSGSKTTLKENRKFQAEFMVDNVHLDSTNGNALWVGAIGISHESFFDGLAALQTNASAAYKMAQSSGAPLPRPHTHLRPSADAPPDPAMPSGALHIDLGTGDVTLKLLQRKQLASVSWSHQIGERIFMGSPWDDGILACPISS